MIKINKSNLESVHLSILIPFWERSALSETEELCSLAVKRPSHPVVPAGGQVRVIDSGPGRSGFFFP